MSHLSTNELVASRLPGQAELLFDLTERGVTPGMLLIRDTLRPDTSSYAGALLSGRRENGDGRPLRGHAARLAQCAGELGLNLEARQIGRVETIPGDEIINRIDEVNEDPSIHGLMVLAPLVEPLGGNGTSKSPFLDRVLAAVHPRKDIDYANPWFAVLNGNRPIPPTPLSMIDMLRFHGLWDPSLTYTLQGSRGKVGGPIARELRRMFGNAYERKVWEIERANKDELPDAMAQTDVVIAAAGVANTFTAERLSRAKGQLQAVLAIGLHDFAPGAQEAASELGIATTPPPMHPAKLGVGAGTALNAWDNTLHNAAVAAGLKQSRVPIAA